LTKPDDEYGLLIEPVNRRRRRTAGQNCGTGTMRHPKIFTPAALDEIKTMVAQGLDKQLIADKVGCTPGSLKVVCCKNRISLRQPDRKPRQPKPAEPKLTALRLSISHLAMLRLQKHASDTGQTATKLAADLLEVITEDGLYDAVIDDRQPETEPA
jgi:hypothetical protein